MVSNRPLTVRVHARSAAARHGSVAIGGLQLPCAFGKSGSKTIKREGDGASPIGLWPVRWVYYRADKVQRPRTGVRVRVISHDDGWCDAPADRNYNRPVRHPYPASAEHLWRNDDVYDIVVVLGHNDRPRKRGMGSAIFVHLARAGYPPTEGCIALSLRDLRRVVERLRPGARLRVL